jgi:hypothetical protein
MKSIIFTLSFLIVICFSSCIDEIDLELDKAEYTRLIVDGQITDRDEPQKVVLTLTSAFDSNQPNPPATGARVVVTTNNDEYHLEELSPGVYQTDDFKGEVGKTYHLEILYGDELYLASSKMHPAFVIDSAGFKKFPFGTPADLPHWEILIYGQDNPDYSEFHLFQYSINGVWQDTLYYSALYADWLTNGLYVKGETVNIYSSREETVEVSLRAISIDENYFWFARDCVWATMPNMFFSPPRANINGNVSNGALGYFRASAVFESGTYTLRMSR